MRKIWQRRDKRKSLNTDMSNAYGYYDSGSIAEMPQSPSFSTLHEYRSSVDTDRESTNFLEKVPTNQSFQQTIGTTTDTLVSMPAATPISSKHPRLPEVPRGGIPSLVKLNYDTRLSKNNWMNVCVNSNTVGDINEQSLKLFRCELRGSSLYLYRPANTLHIKSFKINNDADDTLSVLNGSQEDLRSTSDGGFEPPTNLKSIFNGKNGSFSTLGNSINESSLDKHLNEDSEVKITYHSANVPHPDLVVDAAGQILSGSTEAIAHYILFSENESQVDHLINLLPLFNNFERLLKYVILFSRTFEDKSIPVHQQEEHGRFEGSDLIAHHLNSETGGRPTTIVIERVTALMSIIYDSFFGVLLNTEVFSLVQELLDVIPNTENSEEFKNKIHAKHRSLVSLTNGLLSDSSSVDQSLNPFSELNCHAFLKLNQYEFAQQINLIDLKFNSTWNQQLDKSLLISSNLAHHDYFKKNPLIFNNNTHIHYLSRLLVNQLLVERVSAETKAKVIEKWIELGCLLDKTGNMVSWLGVSTMILSQPILRLSKIWSYVTPEYIKILKNDWSPVVFELDRRILIDLKNSYHVIAPRGLGKIYSKKHVVPFFGDLIIYNDEINIKKYDKNFKRIKYSFNRWRDYLKNIDDNEESIHMNSNILKNYENLNIKLSNDFLNNILNMGLRNDPSTAGSDDAKELGGLSGELEKVSMNGDTNHIGNGHSKAGAYVIPTAEIDIHIQKLLYKLLEINYDSWSLDKVMHLSLECETHLAENYLVQPPIKIYKSKETNSSDASVSSNGSLNSENPSESDEITPLNRLPLFNNSFFRIDLRTYGDTSNQDEEPKPVAPPPKSSRSSKRKHQELPKEPQEPLEKLIPIDESLVFKIEEAFTSTDDFSSYLDEYMPTPSPMAPPPEGLGNKSDDEDHDGLAIDIESILAYERVRSDEDSHTNSSKEVSELLKEAPIVSRKEQSPETETLASDNDGKSELSESKISTLIPKFVTLDRLVDLLVIESKYFYTDTEVSMNINEFRHVFLLNYNSFTTTHLLLEKLTDRFTHSRNAAASIMRRSQRPKVDVADHHAFPSWSYEDNDTTVDNNILLVIQVNVLKTLGILLENFYDSFTLDLRNKAAIIDLLKIVNNEILQWYNIAKGDESNGVEENFENLVNHYKKLRKIFIKKTYRPLDSNKKNEYLADNFKFNSSLHEVPLNRNLPSPKNIAKIEKFLNKFNDFLALFYKNITTNDWFEVFKIFEIQFQNNNLLNFKLQKPLTTGEDVLVFSNIFNYLETLYDPANNELVLLKFPVVLKKLFKLYFKFKNYLLIQLTDLTITVEERIDRMRTVLIMTSIARLKMAENNFAVPGKGPIPSFIETALTNVIYTPESRTFTNFWVKASAGLLTGIRRYEIINDLLPRLSKEDISKTDPYLPCIGWVFENLMEINKVPNYNSSNRLINFNKRYLLFKFIKQLELIDVGPDAKDDLHDFEFLISLTDNYVDFKNLKEFNLLEKEKLKMFRRVISDEYKILKIDNSKKILRDNKISQTLAKKASNSNLKRQSVNYKNNANSRFKISGIFARNTRPFSLNVPAFANQSPEKVINANELPSPELCMDPKQKASIVIHLKGKKIFPVYLFPSCFKIDSDSGDECFFQAPSDSELNDWLVKLNYANRHWFFSKSLNARHQRPFITFGIPIEVVCNRENSLSPFVLEKIFQEIEEYGIKELGVYRISPSFNELNSLKSEIDTRGEYNASRPYDIHTLTSAVKLYLRELPDALLTDGVIQELYTFRNAPPTRADDVFTGYRTILSKLPLHNYHTLRRLMLHLTKVNAHNAQNRMTASNLATVIGPALTEPSTSDLLVNSFGFINPIVEQFVTYFDAIFRDN